MDEVGIFVVLYEVGHPRGGMIRNALHKARIVSERLHRPVTVLTLDFNPDLEETRRELDSAGLLGHGVVLHNLFEDAGACDRTATTFFTHGPRARSSAVEPCPFDALDGGLPAGASAADSRSPHGQLTVTHADADGRPLRTESFDHQGRLRSIECIDPSSEAPVHRRYYGPLGRLRAEAVDAAGDDRSSRWPTVFCDESGEITSVFDSRTALRTAWLDSYAARCDESIFQIESKSALLARAVLDMTAPGVARVMMLHVSHLDDPYTYGAPTKPVLRKVLERLDDFDAFVLITEAHRKDIETEFGPRENLRFVTHDAPASRAAISPAKDPLLGVGVGRFSEGKNWDRVIRAFAGVVREIPGARFELWGMGPLRETYEALIAELGLARDFRIMGVTDDAASVFASAAYSVQASSSEAFGLVLLESLAAGTPVIASDAKYGMIDIVRDGIDGTIVPRGEEGALAEAMIRMLRDPERTREMGRRALEIDDRFSEERCVDGWLDVYRSALEMRDRRAVLPPLRAKAAKIACNRRECTISGSATLGRHARDAKVVLYLRDRSTVLGARYVDLDAGDVRGEERTFSVSFDPAFMADEGRTWDAYLSVTVRNAHRFVRLEAEPGAISARGSDPLPFSTVKGNLSWKPLPPPVGLRAKVRRRLRRLLRSRGPASS